MYTVILDVLLLNVTMCIGWILATYAVRVVHIMLAIAPITKHAEEVSFTSFSAMFMGLRCMQNVYDIICPTQQGQPGYRHHSCMNGVQLVQVNKNFVN